MASKPGSATPDAGWSEVTHVFFDVGGVLGSSGWGTEPRALAVERFGLDEADFDRRHREVVGPFEEGRMTLDEYLDCTVFDATRRFGRDEFKAFMLAQSRPFPETIAIARELAGTGRYRLMTLNNESTELNAHRLKLFGLAPIFSAFFSSCWLGATKPSRRIYELSRKKFLIQQGSLYPSLHRLESRGWVKGKWVTMKRERRVKYYEATRAGRKQLEMEKDSWRKLAAAIAEILKTT